jgi:hypothetical protein
VLQGVLDKYRRGRLRSVPFFDGLLSGEVDALVESFSGVCPWRQRQAHRGARV